MKIKVNREEGWGCGGRNNLVESVGCYFRHGNFVPKV
jgi:hypothetical protein